jgi:hypothetical protein
VVLGTRGDGGFLFDDLADKRGCGGDDHWCMAAEDLARAMDGDDEIAFSMAADVL